MLASGVPRALAEAPKFELVPKKWFDKAIAIKDKQIDTLYFLSRYDEEAGDREAAIEKLEKAATGNFSPLNYCSRETILKEIERLKGAN